MTVPLIVYRGLSRVAGPFRFGHFLVRLARGKEIGSRLQERYGHSSVARPDGPLLWFHAASNGEALSTQPLITAMQKRYPALSILLTTGTVSAALLVAKRMPDVIHQFVPSEAPGAITAFLRHWRPNMAVFVESEIWPNILRDTAATGVPMALVNGRMSKRSAASWGRASGTIKELLSVFTVRLVQTEDVRDRMIALGAPPETTHVTGDLKASRAVDLPEASALAALLAEIGDRLCWLAASTHPGEEEAVANAHEALALRVPTLLTILAPRHDWRGDEIAAMLRARGLTVHQRSKGELPEGAAIYLADTLGEMPLWYALAPIAYVGAGWGELGGHNPLEPAQAGAAVLSGPRVANFADSYDMLLNAGAARFVADGEELTAALLALTDGDGHLAPEARAMAEAGKAVAVPDPRPLEKTMDSLTPLADRAFR